MFVSGLHYLGKQNGVMIFRNDFYIYLIYFALGMLMAANRQAVDRLHSIVLLGLFAAGTGAALYCIGIRPAMPASQWLAPVATVAASTAFYLLVFKVFSTYHPSPALQGMVRYASQASFCVFLFHRPVWSVMNLAWFQSSSILHALYIIVFGGIGIFIMGHWVQNFYNRLVK